jgi:choline dehydrogenase-like flavoprotein
MWEQAPRAENRVALGPERDRLGMPRVELHWRKDALDRRTATGSARGLAALLAENDLGRMRLIHWIEAKDSPIRVDPHQPAHHHLGGTRMSETPAAGVVDTDLRVHGLGNLYVAGASVFPTGAMPIPS